MMTRLLHLMLLAGGSQVTTATGGSHLAITQNRFAFDGQPVFLNGVNQPWIQYGDDFGNNQSHGLFCSLREVLVNTSLSGGHAMRIWLHVEGDNTPQWNASGYVTGTDGGGSLIADMRAYLRAAQELDILVFFVLWNGAVLRNAKTKALFSDDAKLRSYIDTVLKPMAAALQNEPALGGWEVSALLALPCSSHRVRRRLYHRSAVRCADYQRARGLRGSRRRRPGCVLRYKGAGGLGRWLGAVSPHPDAPRPALHQPA